MKVKHSIKKKFAAVFLVMAVFIAVGIGFFSYRFSYSQVVSQYKQDALRVAHIVAELAHSCSFNTYISEGADSSYYEIYDNLKVVKEIYDLKHLYIFRPDTEVNNGVYIFDIFSDGDDKELIADLGDETGEIDIYDLSLEIFLTGSAQNNTVITNSQYGFLASAYAPVYAPDGSIIGIAGVDIPMSVILKAVRTQAFQIIWISLVLITFSLAILMIALRSLVIKPTLRLSRYMNEYVSGDDELKEVEIKKTGDEFQVMSENFNRMVIELRLYMEDLAKVTADRERIATELNVATQIQASMLPCIFPAFPEHAEFDIYATMRSAKEVGGDFYDFFLINDRTLGVVMADVSGKGVSAALFMVIAKTLIKNNAHQEKSPKEVFEVVNNLLCENNEAGMFVTAFLGYLDLPTGKFTFVNAGHNPPLIKIGGKHEWLKTKPDFILAGMEDMFYKQHEIVLSAGDEMILYTDGVTEANNPRQELFGEKRLFSFVSSCGALPLKETIVSLKREIDRFADGAEQADDITVLMLRYNGVKNNIQSSPETTHQSNEGKQLLSAVSVS